MKLDWRNSLLQISSRGPEMLVKIQPIAPQVAQAHYESPEQHYPT